MSSGAEREIPSRLLFHDPLEILLAKEARTCRGCDGEHHAVAFGQTVTICTKKDQNGKRRNHGRRCKDYTER